MPKGYLTPRSHVAIVLRTRLEMPKEYPPVRLGARLVVAHAIPVPYLAMPIIPYCLSAVVRS